MGFGWGIIKITRRDRPVPNIYDSRTGPSNFGNIIDGQFAELGLDFSKK